MKKVHMMAAEDMGYFLVSFRWWQLFPDWFQIVSGWFHVVLDDFRLFQVVSSFSKCINVLTKKVLVGRDAPRKFCGYHTKKMKLYKNKCLEGSWRFNFGGKGYKFFELDGNTLDRRWMFLFRECNNSYSSYWILSYFAARTSKLQSFYFFQKSMMS